MKRSSVVVDSSLAVFTVLDSELSQLAIRTWTGLVSAKVIFLHQVSGDTKQLR